MNESPERQAVVVGLFVTIGLAILIGALFTLGSITEGLSSNIRVTAVFDEVNGLKAGDSVWYSGVRVGTVKGVSFQKGAEVEVEMAIDEEATPFIHGDSLAKVSSDGLIGNKIVVLYAGTPEGGEIEAGDVLQVGEAVSPEQIMTMFQENNENLLAITTDLKAVSAQIAAGEGTVGKLLKDDRLYTDVTTTVAAMQDASVNAQIMTGNLATLAEKANRAGSLPHDLVSDDTTYKSLTASVEKFELAASDAALIIDKLEQGTSDPATPIGTLLHDEQAGADLKQTLDNLNSGSELLSENLEAMQHNFLLRGFFKKKERAKEEQKQKERERALSDASSDASGAEAR